MRKLKLAIRNVLEEYIHYDPTLEEHIIDVETVYHLEEKIMKSISFHTGNLIKELMGEMLDDILRLLVNDIYFTDVAHVRKLDDRTTYNIMNENLVLGKDLERVLETVENFYVNHE